MANVYIVHCVDTEGPLNESLEATFIRVKNVTGVEISPSKDNLIKIQNKEIDLKGYEDIAAKIFSKRIMSYNKTWSDVDKMLDHITSVDFRKKHADSYGNGWQYSWFIVDFSDFVINPRCRDIGYNNIYDHYKSYYRINKIKEDDFQWHAHPMSIYKEAHHCGTSYMNSPHIIQSLARRLIDRGEFPSCFRPGFHTERQDSHWLLEQYIPYDFGNQAVELTTDDLKPKDLSEGRFGDWRRALSTWEPYHPAHDDYQVSGNCNRIIFRCLNVGTRLRLLTQQEVDKAFERANNGEDTILAFCDHDFRDMSYDVDEVYNFIQKSASKYPDVKWINSKASEAARIVTKALRTPINIKAYWDEDCSNRLVIETNIDTFGSQPFFAVKLKGDKYIVENIDIQIPKRKWTYTFDDDSIHLEDIDKIGIASNSLHGTSDVLIFDLSRQKYV